MAPGSLDLENSTPMLIEPTRYLRTCLIIDQFLGGGIKTHAEQKICQGHLDSRLSSNVEDAIKQHLLAYTDSWTLSKQMALALRKKVFHLLKLRILAIHVNGQPFQKAIPLQKSD
ncbi:hypothetical protein PCANC_09932 [Puccinia coronata f. sp. avenae]|uniref:Uncharacterized protein n=1 Tax=Puccinia coronata f. sp. avenae TaxID=200324 RepID=A0A2N5V2X9_9BASI|nr:hypothetical protein PCANC_17463 [Puccinia coronata f. sp. avenae]PLW41821.1 hypothetical protein PCASD_05544 [Puccinia coronata f. sp. avenae]PLW44343.1 hypothetical protein PCANC_09932 [Puccinia coronata f. sp. avenae]